LGTEKGGIEAEGDKPSTKGDIEKGGREMASTVPLEEGKLDQRRAFFGSIRKKKGDAKSPQ